MISLLIDTSNILWRFFSIHPDVPTLVISHISALAEQFCADYIFLALDCGVPAFRKILVDYKGQRRTKEDSIKRQEYFEFAGKVLPMLEQTFVTIQVKGFEADDVIAVLAKQLVGHKVIVSADTDYLQLLSDTVHVYNEQQLYTPEVFTERFGFTPDKFVMYKAMVGDRSDNIKGVQGVGAKTAGKILQKVETVEELIEYSNNAESKIVSRIAEQKEAFYRALAVIRLPAPKIIEELSEGLPFIYQEVRETSLPFISDWTKQEIISNLQGVKNCTIQA